MTDLEIYLECLRARCSMGGVMPNPEELNRQVLVMFKGVIAIRDMGSPAAAKAGRAKAAA